MSEQRAVQINVGKRIDAVKMKQYLPAGGKRRLRPKVAVIRIVLCGQRERRLRIVPVIGVFYFPVRKQIMINGKRHRCRKRASFPEQMPAIPQ